MCLFSTGYPTLGMYFKLTESSSMTTGRCGTWCTEHLRNGPACVISLSYGSIKHFIIKHYSKQTVSLKGGGEKNNMSECCVLSPLSPDSRIALLLFFIVYSVFLLMEPQPQYKNRSKGNQRSICPSSNFFFH